MTAGRAALLGLLLAACGASDHGERAPMDASNMPVVGFEAPVMLNPEPPVRYPPELFRRRTGGSVVLRLHLDAEGRIIMDSTQIHESSGFTALDSAALAAVDSMRFAPARRDGIPVSTTFLQPIYFRQPS